jgi:hypothetical protein
MLRKSADFVSTPPGRSDNFGSSCDAAVPAYVEVRRPADFCLGLLTLRHFLKAVFMASSIASVTRRSISVRILRSKVSRNGTSFLIGVDFFKTYRNLSFFLLPRPTIS